MTKKKSEVTKAGAVELSEDALDQASGGILIGLNQPYKFDAAGLKIGDASHKINTIDNKLTDSSFKFKP